MILQGKTPTVLNVPLTEADTEYFQLLPTGTKKFTIQNREDEDIKFSFTEGTSGTVFLTVPAGSSVSESGINTAPGTTMYLQSGVAGGTAEVLVWT